VADLPARQVDLGASRCLPARTPDRLCRYAARAAPASL